MLPEKIINFLELTESDLQDYSKIKLKYNVLNHQIETQKQLIQDTEFQLLALEDEHKLLLETKKILETFKNYKLQEKKDFILGIINSAITDIFDDNLFIDIIPKEKKSDSKGTQKYDIVFYQNGIEIARNDELLKSNGGGILQVISILFKILIGYLYSENTFYTLDESFSQVSTQYRTRLSIFLREFCERYNFTLVVVSHSNELDEYAHLVYSLNYRYDDKNIKELLISEISSNLDNSNLDGYFLDITNFQSIKRASFKFLGFTIIRGPNNTGKSAILRSIQSIVYNDFSKNYLRLNTKKCRIEFGVLKNDIKEKSIVLEYQSQKIKFIINGNEFYGKNLAANKLQEAVEELGFKYIKTKEFYKNFKGNMKEQTERIASTTQFDNLFLIGGKVSETEKIFNFLFNTENISLAIIKCKEDISKLEKYFEDLNTKIEELKFNLIDLYKKSKILKILNDYLLIHNGIKLINNKNFLENDLEKLQKKYKKIKILLDKINYYQSIDPNIKYLNDMDNFIISLNNKINYYQNKIKNLTELITKYQEYLKFIELSKSKNDLDNKIIWSENIINSKNTHIKTIDNILKNLKSLLELNINLNTLLMLNDKCIQNQEKINLYKLNLSNLNKKYSLHKCDKCSGIGYHILKENND